MKSSAASRRDNTPKTVPLGRGWAHEIAPQRRVRVVVGSLMPGWTSVSLFLISRISSYSLSGENQPVSIFTILGSVPKDRIPKSQQDRGVCIEPSHPSL